MPERQTLTADDRKRLAASLRDLALYVKSGEVKHIHWNLLNGLARDLCDGWVETRPTGTRVMIIVTADSGGVARHLADNLASRAAQLIQ